MNTVPGHESSQKLTEQAEKAVLGGMLIDNLAIPEVMNILHPRDFFNVRHEIVYTAVAELWAAGEDVDPLNVAEHVRERGNLDRIGGHPYLFNLLESAPVKGMALSHAEQVADSAARRRLAAAGTEIAQHSWEGDIADAVAHAQTLIEDVYRPSGDSVRHVGEHLDETLDFMEQLGQGLIPEGLPTGYTDLDDMTGGFQPGQMIVVAARPGVGKSTLAVDVMRHLSIQKNVPTLMFSLEMSEREIHMRMLSAESGVHTKYIKSGKIRDEDRGKLVSAAERIKESPIYIDESPELDMLGIMSKTKMLVAQKNIGLVVVDYLQLLKSGTKAESRQQEIADISRQLKLLAKSCKIPIIAVAQLNRGVEQRGDDALPKASDLRDSGAIEQDADMVMLLHRPDRENPDHERAGETDIIVGKNRAGQVGTATVVSQLHYSRFVNFKRGF